MFGRLAPSLGIADVLKAAPAVAYAQENAPGRLDEPYAYTARQAKLERDEAGLSFSLPKTRAELFAAAPEWGGYADFAPDEYTLAIARRDGTPVAVIALDASSGELFDAAPLADEPVGPGTDLGRAIDGWVGAKRVPNAFAHARRPARDGK